jgi:hypothetical protein
VPLRGVDAGAAAAQPPGEGVGAGGVSGGKQRRRTELSNRLDLVEMGMMQRQNWNLEQLAQDRADDGRYAFLLSAPPEPFTGGVGSPVVPVAVK